MTTLVDDRTEIAVEPSPPGRQTRGPRRTNERLHHLALVVVLAVVSLGGTAFNSPGAYIADSRFEHYWSSVQYLSRHQWLWDSFRGLGRTAPYFAPAVASVLAGLAALGVSAAMAERLLHALYLFVAGLGMVHVMRLFRPKLATEHFLAALVYMFSPYTAQFLLPSGLFLHYAIAPWLLVALARGVRSENRGRWRWPAAFALVVFAVGSLNIPSLMYACVPLVPFVLFAVHIERSSRWRDVGGFVVRAGSLIALGSVATLLQLKGNAPVVAENLSTTELPSTVSRSSSWAESWRGLGFWLTYFRTGAGLARPEAAPYLTNATVIASTFAVPCIAISTLWWSRWRPRLLFAGMVLVSLVLMVGLYPVENSAPVGQALDGAYSGEVFLRGLRSGYKAGAGLSMGIAVLFAVGVADAARRLRHRVIESVPGPSVLTARVMPVAAVAIIAISSFPFWTGALYSPNDRFDSLPAYWEQAIGAVNALPGDGRVLVMPGAERNRYRWGYLGDDMFDAELTHPHLQRQSFTQGMPETGNLLSALDERTANDNYVPGSFAPMARVLGVRWVLIRNDLDWQDMDAPRPANLDGLRDDPDLRRVASFGANGQNTTSPADPGAGVLGENDLPPVELYEVSDGGEPVQLLASGAPLLTSGDGEGLMGLAPTGVLGASPGFRFTASTSASDLSAYLDAGAHLVVTDSNRRRTTQVTSNHNLLSYTLADGTDLDRPALDLFGVAGSQSVATYGAASNITASGFGSALARYQDWLRPANAFDGDGSTAWRTAGAADPVGEWIEVDLATATPLREIDLTPVQDGAKRHISRVTVRFSDGTELESFVAPTGTTPITFPVRSAESFRVRIDAISGTGDASVGFSEIVVPGLDLAERVVLPDDVFRAASSDADLAANLEHADVTYAFDRLERLGTQDEEMTVRRRFRTAGSRTFIGSGAFRLTASTPDEVIDELVGGPVGAWGSSRFGEGASGWGRFAVDGDLDTSWLARALPGATLTTRFPTQLVTHVDITTAVPTPEHKSFSPIDALDVTVGDAPPIRCLPAASPADPAPACHLDVPPTITDSIVVSVAAVDHPLSTKLGLMPVGIAEVHADSLFGAMPVASTPTSFGRDCRSIASIDGRRLTARLSGTVDDFLAGHPTSFEGCAPVALSDGWHDLDSASSVVGVLSHLELTTASPSARTSTADATVEVTRQDPAGATIRVDAPDGGTVTLGQSYATGWEASVNGRDVAAAPLNTMSSWAVPPGTSELEVGYRPQRIYELGLAGMAAAAVMCLVLVFRREPALVAAPSGPRHRRATAHLQRQRTRDWPAVVLIATIGFLFANLEGAVLGLGAVIAARVAGVRLVGKAATWALILAAVTTLSAALPATPAQVATFVADRELASIVGQFAATLVAAYVVLAALGERSLEVEPSPRRASLWERARTGWSRRVLPVVMASAAAVLVAATVGTRANGSLVMAAAFAVSASVTSLALLENVMAKRGNVLARTHDDSNHMLQGSVWLMAGFVVQAVTGVAFWIVAARVNPTTDVGSATALFACLQFINYATALGLPEMLARYSSTHRRDADVLFTRAVFATTVSSAVGAVVVGGLAYVRGGSLSPLAGAGGLLAFFVISVGAAIALLVDARLMTARRWRWVFGRLVAVGAVRIPLLLAPAPVDASLWLFLVIAGPIAVSGLVGLVVLRRDEGLRLRFSPSPASGPEATRYALVNFVSHLALSAPQFALPVIVLAHVDASTNANFFVAWSIAAVAFILPVTIGRVLLTEGSRTEHMLEDHTTMAFKLGIALMIVAAIATAALRPVMVVLYGDDYSTAADILPALVLGGVPWSITAIALGRARVRHDHVGTVLMTVTLAVTILGAALIAVPSRGIDGAVAAWLLGTVVSAVVAVAVSLRPSAKSAPRPVTDG